MCIDHRVRARDRGLHREQCHSGKNRSDRNAEHFSAQSSSTRFAVAADNMRPAVEMEVSASPQRSIATRASRSQILLVCGGDDGDTPSDR